MQTVDALSFLAILPYRQRWFVAIECMQIDEVLIIFLVLTSVYYYFILLRKQILLKAKEKKMNYLQQRILADGIVVNENILKVDSFLNHQIDPKVVKETANEILNYFKGREITKVITIEASGIAPALQVATELNVPMLFAKKTEPSTMDKGDQFTAQVHSYTKNKDYRVIVSKKYLSSDDKVLIVDDFLANGEAARGLIDLVNQAGAELVGVGIAIEKSFQAGRQSLEDLGVDIYSVCRLASLENKTVTFVEED